MNTSRTALHIDTPRLFLRPVENADAEPTAALVTPDVAENLSTWPSPMAVSEVQAKIELSKQGLADRRMIDFAILLKPQRRLIGWIGILKTSDDAARLGYWLGTQFRGQGLMTEAARHSLPVAARALQASTILANVPPSNRPSIAILQSLGFAADGEELVFRASRGRSEMMFRYRMNVPPAS